MRDAGRSARQQYRQAKAARSRLRQSGIFRVGYGLGLTALALFIAKVPLQEQWPSTLAIGAAVLALYVAFLRWPQEFLTLVVVAVWVIVCPAVTWLVVAVTPELLTDYTARIAALALYGGLIGFLSIKYRNGHLPWLTCLISLASTAAVATIFYHLGWSGGLWLGYAIGLLVVGLRGGGWDRLMDTWDWLVERKPLSRAKSTSEEEKPVDPEEQWAADAKAEIATAKLLSALPRDYVVLHDRRMPGADADEINIDHIVVGPAGMFVVESRWLTGKVTKRSNGRLWHGNSPFDMALLTVFWQAEVVASHVKLPTRAVMVVHSAKLPQPRLKVGLFSHKGQGDRARAGDVVVVSASDGGPVLLGEFLTPAGETWSRGEVHRYARRARRAFAPASAPLTAPTDSEREASEDLWPVDVDPVLMDAESGDAEGTVKLVQPRERQTQGASASQTGGGSESAGPSPSSGPPPAEELPEHREYEWGQSEREDEMAKENQYEVERCEFKVGDRVHVLRSSGMLAGWVVLSPAYLHEEGEGGTPVIDIASPEEITFAEAEGTKPRYIAEPIEHLIKP